MSPEVAFCTSHDPFFETARNDHHDYVPISAWEPAQNDESELSSGKAAVAAKEDAPSGFKRCLIESCCNENDDIIAQKVMSTVRELAANGMATMVEEALDEVLHKTLHNPQSGVR